MVFHYRFRDAQCGFKAVRTAAARQLLPEIVDQAWFFATELLLVAERNGLRISEIPVDWTDEPDSRVKLIRSSIDDLKDMVRLAMALWRSELLRVALRRHLQRLASEMEVRIWEDRPLDEGEQSLAKIADWGPAEDWSDWLHATG